MKKISVFILAIFTMTLFAQNSNLEEQLKGVTKEQLVSMIFMMEKSGKIDADSASKAREQLKKMSNEDFKVLKYSAGTQFRANPSQFLNLFSAGSKIAPKEIAPKEIAPKKIIPKETAPQQINAQKPKETEEDKLKKTLNYLNQ